VNKLLSPLIFLMMVAPVAVAGARTDLASVWNEKGDAVRLVIPLNDGWKFSKGDIRGASDAGFNDAGWESVSLPHTWNNLDGQDGGNDYYRGPAWYRKSFHAPENDKGKSAFLRFGAAGFVAVVYVNGSFVGEHRGGFAAFAFNITRFLKYGEDNIVAVKVDNTSPGKSADFQIAPISADFTMEGGLYRKASLIFTEPVHISMTDYASPGVFIMQKNVTDSLADLRVTAVLRNDSEVEAAVLVRTEIFDAAGKGIRETDQKAVIGAGSDKEVVQELSIDNPRLWNGRIDPYLYKVVVSVYRNNKLVDREEQPLGLRFYTVDPDKGFILNGKPYKLHGVALHEDKLDEGRAITGADRRQEMNDILDIGATVIRMSHYQYDQEMYRLCDRYGIVVWTEIPLVNQIVDSKSFEENAGEQLKELIRQNYNHPSVLFWGIFNEIHNQKGPDPLPLVRRLNALAKQEDPTRPTTAASDDEDSTNFVTDILGLNKYFGWYYGSARDLGPFLDKWHKEHPDRAIGISEYGAGGSVYHHEELPAIQPRTDGPWHPEEYQTEFHEISWKAIEDRPYIWFSTLWNMYDFASDSRMEGFRAGINDKGIITQGHETKKDAYYWYKANWNPAPMVHINSKAFAVRDTSVITVEVYSNAGEAELFVNGNSLGRKTSADHRFFWTDVRLNPGSNYVKATAVFGGKEYFDQCWWRFGK
jgi:beta-galactosidase